MFNLTTPVGTTERVMKLLDEPEMPWFFKTDLRPQEPPVYWGLSEQDWADICQEPKPDAK